MVRPSTRSKCLTVVGEQREVVPQGSGADEQIEVADNFPSRAQAPPLPREDAGDFLIDGHELHFAQKGVEFRLIVFALAGPIDAFVDLGQRNHAHPHAGGKQFAEPSADWLDRVQVVNHPV